MMTRNILTLATPSLSILSMYCLMLLVGGTVAFYRVARDREGLTSVMLIIVVKRPAIRTWILELYSRS